MKRSLSYLMLFILLALTAKAQVSSVSGIVTSKDGALPYVAVGLEGTDFGALSGEEGQFEIKNVPFGSYNLIVSAVGFRLFNQVIEVHDQLSTDLKIELTEDLLNLEEVVVSGTRYEYDKANAPVVVNVLGSKLLNATQSIAISEGLNFQSGVRIETNCQNCGFTQVRMNGLEGSYSQILINSRPIFSALNSVYGLDQIPTNIVKQIEVVRSGGSALFGSNAIAGTINVITKDPVENSWELRSNTALIDGEALDQTFNYNGSIVNESLSSGVSFYGMNRNRESYDANGDGFTELVQLENNVLGAKAFFKPGERNKLSLDFSSLNEYRRGGDRLDLAPHFSDITEELVHNTIFGGLSFDQWSENEQNKFSFYVSSQSTDRDSYYGGLGGGRTREDSVLAINAYGNTQDLAVVSGVQYNRYLPNADVLTIGLENQYFDTRDEIQGYDRVIDQQVTMTGLFGQYEWKPSSRFTTLLGARFDISNVDGFYQVGAITSRSNVNTGVFSPRLTVMFKPRNNVRLRGGYARGFRAPQAFNEDLHISSVGGEAQFVILSNDLDIETSDAFTASFNITKDLGLAQSNFLVEGFYTRLQNPFTQVSTGSVLPNGSIIEEVRNGRGATVSGVNFESGYSPSTKFAFQVGGTLQQTSYDESQVLFEPTGTPVGGETSVVIEEFVRTPNAYGFLTSSYTPTADFTLDVTASYTGSMIVPRVVSESGFISLIDSETFLDMNLKASYHFEIENDFHLELSGGVKNVLNSFQSEFDVGPERDSDFIFGPAAPRSVFISVRIGNLR